jgi:hypothetical protein
MTDREEIREVAEAHAWQILPDGNMDRYHKGPYDVDTYYDEQDNAKEAHLLLYGNQRDTVTGHQTKAAVIGWLTSPPPISV